MQNRMTMSITIPDGQQWYRQECSHEYLSVIDYRISPSSVNMSSSSSPGENECQSISHIFITLLIRQMRCFTPLLRQASWKAFITWQRFSFQLSSLTAACQFLQLMMATLCRGAAFIAFRRQLSSPQILPRQPASQFIFDGSRWIFSRRDMISHWIDIFHKLVIV